MQPLTREQVRAVDRLAIEELAIPGVVLMENAGLSAAGAVLSLLQERLTNPAAARIAILCGGGNNGGDGYVIARHLHNHGLAVAIHAAVDPATLKGDAAVNAEIARRMRLAIHPITTPAELEIHAGEWGGYHAIVDALLGTGFTGRVVRPHLANVIRRCNAARQRGALIIAVDLPSGLDCDTGQPADAAVEADLTVTFVAPKAGFTNPAAARHLGRVVVADIGVPPELVERVRGG